MELQLINNEPSPVVEITHSYSRSQGLSSFEMEETSTVKPFIQANTIGVSLEEIKNEHIIPVYIKDNEVLMSHTDFIEAAMQIASDVFPEETVLKPNIRVSHPIKGRIPEAKNKPANELHDHEKTLYYERMMFCIEIPTICVDINGNKLSLTIGGVKAFNLDTLYSKKGSDEHFKIFIGFKNIVCTNLCIQTDGNSSDLKVNNIGQLKACIRTLIENYNAPYHIHGLRKLSEYSLTEKQFAQLIGRCRLYQHLPKNGQTNIPPLLYGDNQLSAICKDYYRDESFCRDENGDINLWKLYNLLTGSNKSSYIDSFLDRSVNAFSFTEQLRWALEGRNESWYLN
jgi:Domain of unknown function, B. Theta Gene description (DUF3871)